MDGDWIGQERLDGVDHAQTRAHDGYEAELRGFDRCCGIAVAERRGILYISPTHISHARGSKRHRQPCSAGQGSLTYSAGLYSHQTMSEGLAAHDRGYLMYETFGIGGAGSMRAQLAELCANAGVRRYVNIPR